MPLSFKDYMVDNNFIMTLWRNRKLQNYGAKVDIIVSRCKGAVRCVDEMDHLVRKEREIFKKQQMLQVKGMLQKGLQEFVDHPAVGRWKDQYEMKYWGDLMRFVTLVFRGGSQKGKTQKAKAIFGEETTLLVNCQGLNGTLPDVSKLNDPDEHYTCIVFDEITTEQVLRNKQVFQAGNDMVALAQSVCNQHSYQIWPYQMALIGCSNDFPMTVEESQGKLKEEDAEWLDCNVALVELPPEQTWFKSNHSKPRASFHEKYSVTQAKKKLAAAGGG